MSTFCFETKVQPLSKLQNRGLLSDEFFHELAKAHERSSSDLKPPFNATLVQQSILPGLYVSVIIHGGYDAVVKSQKWNEVALCINYSVSDLDGDGAPLSAYYRKYLLPLEKLCSESQEGLNRLWYRLGDNRSAVLREKNWRHRELWLFQRQCLSHVRFQEDGRQIQARLVWFSWYAIVFDGCFLVKRNRKSDWKPGHSPIWHWEWVLESCWVTLVEWRSSSCCTLRKWFRCS